MRKLLKQKTTGTIYVWTENLAQRPDMELYVPEPKLPAEPEPQPENTSQNPTQASADQEPDNELSTAITAFRRQVSKAGRKPSTKSSEQA